LPEGSEVGGEIERPSNASQSEVGRTSVNQEVEALIGETEDYITRDFDAYSFFCLTDAEFNI
jgi:hypothetical protein